MTRAVAHVSRHRGPYTIGLLLVLAVATAVTVRQIWAAELKAPQPNDRYVAMTVASKLQEEHLTRHPLDTEISQRMFKGFLKTLDPLQALFLASRLRRVQAVRETSLPKRFATGTSASPIQCSRAFLKRDRRADAMVDTMLKPDNKFDFTVDEEIRHRSGKDHLCGVGRGDESEVGQADQVRSAHEGS